MKQQQLQTKPKQRPFDLRLPVDLHKELKIESARQGISMNEYVATAIREKLGREAK